MRCCLELMYGSSDPYENLTFVEKTMSMERQAVSRVEVVCKCNNIPASFKHNQQMQQPLTNHAVTQLIGCYKLKPL
jgi:hypothetical protein